MRLITDERPGAELHQRGGETEELWRRYREDHDVTARGALAGRYLPLVGHVARQVSSSLYGRVEQDDLEGYGAEGLLDALDRFDEGRGVQFSTFAAFRIRGAIYDGIRATDWLPKSVRRRERELRETQGRLYGERGRTPTENEEAQELGLSIDALRRHKAVVHSGTLRSLEAPAADHEIDEPKDDGPDPLESFVAAEVAAAVRSAVRQLSERERTVVLLSVSEETTLAEIGRRLGVTESRACQIRQSGFKNLRSHLEDHGLDSMAGMAV